MKTAPRAVLCLFLSALLVAGCATPPIAHNPNTGQLPTNDLKLALVLSDKTKDSVKKFHEAVRLTIKMMGGYAGDFSNKPFDAVNDVLRKDFAEVVIVDSADQAKAAGADVIAVLDYDASGREMSMSLYTISCILTLDLAIPFQRFYNPRLVDLAANVTFLTPDQKQLDLLHMEAHRRSGVGAQLPMMTAQASDEIGGKLENAIAGSEPLLAYARQRAKQAPAAASVAAAPAPAVPAGPVSDVDSPTYVEEERPDDLALVVGIEKYSNIPDAAFAQRDAEAVRKHLLALGYPERNVIYLTGEHATRSAIQKYVEAWLPRNAKPDSEVFFYFSGHGAPDPASKQAYLVPWDGDPKFLENTGYPIEKLYRSLGSLKAKKVVVALDSCFSGAGGRSVIAQGTRPLVMKIDTAIPAGSGKLAVLSASAGDQITGADNAQGHGLFTYYLLRGLNRTGGKATVGDVYHGLVNDVEDAARRQNREQTPQFVAGDGASYFR